MRRGRSPTSRGSAPKAAVFGLLLAGLYRPVRTSAILVPVDFAIAVTAFLVLALWKWPPWLVLAAVAGGVLTK